MRHVDPKSQNLTIDSICYPSFQRQIKKKKPHEEFGTRYIEFDFKMFSDTVIAMGLYIEFMHLISDLFLESYQLRFNP